MARAASRSARPLASVSSVWMAIPCRLSIHHHVAPIRHPRLVPAAFAIELGLRIGRRLMRVVAPGLAAKVVVVIAALLGPAALMRRPGFNQRAIHREMFREGRGAPGTYGYDGALRSRYFTVAQFHLL